MIIVFFCIVPVLQQNSNVFTKGHPLFTLLIMPPPLCGKKCILKTQKDTFSLACVFCMYILVSILIYGFEDVQLYTLHLICFSVLRIKIASLLDRANLLTFFGTRLLFDFFFVFSNRATTVPSSVKDYFLSRGVAKNILRQNIQYYIPSCFVSFNSFSRLQTNSCHLSYLLGFCADLEITA